MISKLEDFDFTMEQSEEGYKNFTVIKCKIKSLNGYILLQKDIVEQNLILITKKNFWLVP